MPEFGKNNKSTVEKEEEVMKIKNKILTIMVTGVALSALIMPNKSNAALQSNGGTPETKDLGTWMLQIRQMQEMGGTLGRTDTIDTTNLTSGATDLDIHMEKNTEYGAMAILSASAYGNPNKINDGETTTGNSTGIVININREWTASGKVSIVAIFENAKNRYKNVYEFNEVVSKIGDAMIETSGWHGSSEDSWLNDFYEGGRAGFIRAYSKSLFSYYGKASTSNVSRNQPAKASNPYASRACIVVGTGI